MSTARTGSFLKTLKTNLEARPALSGVKIYIVQPDVTAVDAISLLRPTEKGLIRTINWSAIGRTRHNDEYQLPGRIVAYKTADAAGSKDASDLAAAALDRCDQLIDEYLAELKASVPNLADQTINALITDVNYLLYVHDRGGWIAEATFTVTLTARSS